MGEGESTCAAVGEAEFDGFFHCLGCDVRSMQIFTGRETGFLGYLEGIKVRQSHIPQLVRAIQAKSDAH